ncbi:uncharacterized protein LOC118897999 [Balaenoptera musculus]|uniref:Uncharacterized protein LOC118897999 n=1 Tax=Balaenoptera musculus TaxID=9771 RepID=A0A8B8XUI6_BALMU|nr:uncharacterized protein LOC118897999 [Balaenoptera musculus]
MAAVTALAAQPRKSCCQPGPTLRTKLPVVPGLQDVRTQEESAPAWLLPGAPPGPGGPPWRRAGWLCSARHRGGRDRSGWPRLPEGPWYRGPHPLGTLVPSRTIHVIELLLAVGPNPDPRLQAGAALSLEPHSIPELEGRRGASRQAETTRGPGRSPRTPCRASTLPVVAPPDYPLSPFQAWLPGPCLPIRLPEGRGPGGNVLTTDSTGRTPPHAAPSPAAPDLRGCPVGLLIPEREVTLQNQF